MTDMMANPNTDSNGIPENIKDYIDRKIKRLFGDGYFNNPYECKSNDPCRNCPNNPANNPFASGFCNCALPYLVGPNRIIY